jgi:endonuclease III
MLYAGNFPVYMLDDYTVRILQRHGYIALNSRETDVQRFIQQELRCSGSTSQEVRQFSNFQALMVRTGREYCAKTKPKCGLCPLFSFLPEGEKVSVSVGLRPPLTVSSGDLRPSLVEKPIEEKQDSVNPVMPELDETERKIVEQITAEPVPIDDVIEKTGLPVHIVRATIAILESRRVVRQSAGNTVKRIV